MNLVKLDNAAPVILALNSDEDMAVANGVTYVVTSRVSIKLEEVLVEGGVS